MGISEYKLTDTIPETMRTNLPSVEELENELSEKMDETVQKSVSKFKF